ncbi:hypothetical protein HYC85_007325 [Camellia sinensis]|uniref:Uncharacterized protein n=1 Tax=Camellia sinensis TaxID=4442 RepID=A0A7J7HP15_CAMSI|nr:hypothetical protein HYC85_007325 [Camellia sinensis]
MWVRMLDRYVVELARFAKELITYPVQILREYMDLLLGTVLTIYVYTNLSKTSSERLVKHAQPVVVCLDVVRTDRTLAYFNAPDGDEPLALDMGSMGKGQNVTIGDQTNFGRRMSQLATKIFGCEMSQLATKLILVVECDNWRLRNLVDKR